MFYEVILEQLWDRIVLGLTSEDILLSKDYFLDSYENILDSDPVIPIVLSGSRLVIDCLNPHALTSLIPPDGRVTR